MIEALIGLIIQFVFEVLAVWERRGRERPALFSFRAGAICAFGMALVRFSYFETEWLPFWPCTPTVARHCRSDQVLRTRRPPAADFLLYRLAGRQVNPMTRGLTATVAVAVSSVAACEGAPTMATGTMTRATIESVLTTFRGTAVESAPVTIPSPECSTWRHD